MMPSGVFSKKTLSSLLFWLCMTCSKDVCAQQASYSPLSPLDVPGIVANINPVDLPKAKVALARVQLKQIFASQNNDLTAVIRASTNSKYLKASLGTTSSSSLLSDSSKPPSRALKAINPQLSDSQLSALVAAYKKLPSATLENSDDDLITTKDGHTISATQLFKVVQSLEHSFHDRGLTIKGASVVDLDLIAATPSASAASVTPSPLPTSTTTPTPTLQAALAALPTCSYPAAASATSDLDAQWAQVKNILNGSPPADACTVGFEPVLKQASLVTPGGILANLEPNPINIAYKDMLSASVNTQIFVSGIGVQPAVVASAGPTPMASASPVCLFVTPAPAATSAIKPPSKLDAALATKGLQAELLSDFQVTLLKHSFSIAALHACLAAPYNAALSADISANVGEYTYKDHISGNTVTYSHSETSATKRKFFAFQHIFPVGPATATAAIEGDGTAQISYVIDAYPYALYARASPQLVATVTGSITAATPFPPVSGSVSGTLTLFDGSGTLGGLAAVFQEPYDALHPIVAVERGVAQYNITTLKTDIEATGEIMYSIKFHKTLATFAGVVNASPYATDAGWQAQVLTAPPL